MKHTHKEKQTKQFGIAIKKKIILNLNKTKNKKISLYQQTPKIKNKLKISQIMQKHNKINKTKTLFLFTTNQN